MKNRYRRVAYYLDENILLRGIKDKRGFHPAPALSCGFSLQKLRKRDVGKTLFYTLSDALKSVPGLEIAGLTLNFGIDAGTALTRIFCFEKEDDSEHGKKQFYHTNTLISSEDAALPVVFEYLQSLGIKAIHDTRIICLFTDSSSFSNKQASRETEFFIELKRFT